MFKFVVTPLVMILQEVSFKVTTTLIHCTTLLAHVIIIIIHLPFHLIHHGLGLNLIIYLSDFMLAEEVTHPDITTIFQQNNI